MDKLFGGKRNIPDTGGTVDKLSRYPTDFIPYQREELIKEINKNPDLFPNLFEALDTIYIQNEQAMQILEADKDLYDLGGFENDDYILYLTGVINYWNNVTTKLVTFNDNSLGLAVENHVTTAITEYELNVEPVSVPNLQKIISETKRCFQKENFIMPEVPIALTVEKAIFDDQDVLVDFNIGILVPLSKAPFSYTDNFGSMHKTNISPQFDGQRLWLVMDGEFEYYWDDRLEQFIARPDMPVEDDGDPLV